MPQKLTLKGPLAATVPYYSALAVGIACTVLIVLVVVTFDSDTMQLYYGPLVLNTAYIWYANSDAQKNIGR